MSQEMQEVPEITKDMEEWMVSTISAPRNIYYKRTGKMATITCAACGKSYTGYTETGEGYEEQFKYVIEKPVHNEMGVCEECGNRGIYKCLGMLKGKYGRSSWCVIGQNLGEDFVFRGFWTDRISIPGEKDIDNIGEYARIYLRKGKKADKWWYRSTGWGIQDAEWVNYFPGVFGQASFKTDHYWPGIEDEIKKTPMLRYGNSKRHDPIVYYSAFARYPDMELVEKAGMRHLTYALLSQGGANINPKGKTIHDRLRIYKERLPWLREKEGDLNYLKIFQEERKLGEHYDREKVEQKLFLEKTYWNREERELIEKILGFTTLKKLVRYMEGHRRNEYLDYIRLRMNAGYDLHNEIYLYPRDLHRQHQEMVRMVEKSRNDKYKKEMMEKWPKIALKYNKLDSKFRYEDGDYIIRPAADAAEIVEEGRILHHCVGSSNTYFSRHSKGESFILFLREKENPDIPLATVEISGSRILQWYEAHDEKPDEKVLQPWLDAYTERLKAKGKKKTAVAG